MGLGGCYSATLEGYELYRSTPLGFSIEYPDFWAKGDDVEGGTATFTTPAEGYSDAHRESLSVQTFEPDMDFDEYIKGYAEDLQYRWANYKLVSETETTLGGEKAYQIVYETSDEKIGQLRILQQFALHEGKVFVVTYVAEFSGYSYFLTYVDKMLSTFQYLG